MTTHDSAAECCEDGNIEIDYGQLVYAGPEEPPTLVKGEGYCPACDRTVTLEYELEEANWA